jgi:uncharacterized phage protein (TIGR01671 family)
MFDKVKYIGFDDEVIWLESINIKNQEMLMDWEGDRYQDSTGCYNDIDFEEVVLMQSTGLYDKNGKEIFEGDIIKGSFIEDNYYEIPLKGEVIFKNGGFGIDQYGFLKGFLCILENERYSKLEIEIVGNIYENPEFVDN